MEEMMKIYVESMVSAIEEVEAIFSGMFRAIAKKINKK